MGQLGFTRQATVSSEPVHVRRAVWAHEATGKSGVQCFTGQRDFLAFKPICISHPEFLNLITWDRLLANSFGPLADEWTYAAFSRNNETFKLLMPVGSG